MKSILSVALTAYSAFAATASGSPHYHIARQIPLSGAEGWDYLSFDAAGNRLFVSHGVRVQVVDTKSAALIGEIADTPGVHGVALAPDLGRGYISAGRANRIVVFDSKSLARLAEIETTGDNPDAVLYEPTTHRVFSFNGRGRNATVIDTASNTAIATIPLEAKPEFAVADGAGTVFVNLEDKNSIAVIDAKKMTLRAVWPIAECDEPSGLALDRAAHRLFAVCDNKVMAIVDSNLGRVVATVSIGEGPDAAAFDPGTGLAFASCGEGVLNIVKETAPGKFAVVQNVTTKKSGRTMALDERTHHVYISTATLGPPPAPTAEQPRPRPAIVPDSFAVLDIEP